MTDVARDRDDAKAANEAKGDAGHISNRDRVRQLLLTPLGFRFKAGTPDDEQRRRLDQICDDLAYLTDADLRSMFDVIKTKGEGSAKAFWPSIATFRGYAEVLRHRPLEELPALVSWFGSREGEAALADGSAVALWRFFEVHKIPPYKPEMKEMVKRRAAEYRRRIEIMTERQDRGVFDVARFPKDAEDAAFKRWYDQVLARATAVVRRAATPEVRT